MYIVVFLHFPIKFYIATLVSLCRPFYIELFYLKYDTLRSFSPLKVYCKYVNGISKNLLVNAAARAVVRHRVDKDRRHLYLNIASSLYEGTNGCQKPSLIHTFTPITCFYNHDKMFHTSSPAIVCARASWQL